jgi:hypothetical protein
MYSTTEIFIQENTVITHEAIQKYVDVHTLSDQKYPDC